MYCGIKSFATAVEVAHLIERLDIERPYSPTYGDVRNEQPFKAEHKGLHFFIKPRLYQPDEYSVEVRGSLAKFANGGLHNHSYPNPYDMLNVVDELATDLRINPFATVLNNLEVMATMRVHNAERLVNNIASYGGKGPKRVRMDNGCLCADIKLTQHRLKVYEPIHGLLRVEIHTDRMAYLGADGPKVLADLALPHYAQPTATKLLKAFNKVVWDCADLNPDTLPLNEGYLLAKGRNPAYWHPDRKGMSRVEYNRIRKQRERERPAFDAIIQQHWRDETPADISQAIQQQLTAYTDIMHTGQYEQSLQRYLERWQVVANLPAWATLPERPQIRLVSQIYTSLISKVATPQPEVASKRPTVKELSEQPEKVNQVLQGHKPRRSRSGRKPETTAQRAHHRLRNMISNEPNNTLRWLRKQVNAPGGLYLPLDEIAPLLSPREQAALAYGKLSLVDLKRTSIQSLGPPFYPLQALFR